VVDAAVGDVRSRQVAACGAPILQERACEWMEVEALLTLDQDAHLDSGGAHVVGRLLSEEDHGEVMIQDGCLRENGEPSRHLLAERGEHFLGEEPVEGFGHRLRALDLGRKDAGEADDRRPPVRELREPRRRGRASLGEDVLGLVTVHGEVALLELEHRAVEDVARVDPRRALTRRDQEPDLRDGDERPDELLRLGCAGDRLVLVDDEPGARRPGLEVLAEDLRERRNAIGGSWDRFEVRAQARVAVLDDRQRCLRDPERKSGDVDRRGSRAEPRTATTVTGDPLLGERGLSVPCGRNQHPDVRPRFVEERIQPWTLDDPASLQRPRLADSRRRFLPCAGSRLPSKRP
jgi:hypothetical protein